MIPMITLENDAVRIAVDKNGRGLVIEDRRRGQRWVLDETTIQGGGEVLLHDHPAHDAASKMSVMEPVSAHITNDGNGDGGGNGRIDITYACPGGRVRYVWSLVPDGAVVEATAEGDILSHTLPGTFVPEGGDRRILLPIMQGHLWSGGGPDMDHWCRNGAHTGFAMQMLGFLGTRGGLLLAPDNGWDTYWRWGRGGGRTWAHAVAVDSLGTMDGPRTARVFVTGLSIPEVAFRYRKLVKDRGRFVSWDEKIAERPGLERLFGCVMLYLGYCQDDVDYVAQLAAVRDFGFDRALVYPVRFNTWPGEFKMGGLPPIHLSDGDLDAIKALGYDIAPWSWLTEAINDGSRQDIWRIQRDGHPPHAWNIDTVHWTRCCSAAMLDFARQANARSMGAMTWDHYDVIACGAIGECHAANHAAHSGRPLSRGDDLANLRTILRAAQQAGRAVSSESFNDLFSLEYDIGSAKAWPRIGPNWPLISIPLTSLVYHDSLLHSWWEPHNYNAPWHSRSFSTGHLEYGGGQPRLMATLDALLGSPPDIFPCGAQYGWTGRQTAGPNPCNETHVYRYRVTDPAVQEAMRLALPVAKLHRRIGRQAMVDFQLLSPDGSVQQTTFADGTTVAANFGLTPRGDIDGIHFLPGESWGICR